MAMAWDQQILDTRADYTNPFEVERGGILSMEMLSGIQYATYVAVPTVDTVPVGLMAHDQEEVDLWRANAPWTSRRAYPPFTAFPYIIQGTVITNAISLDVDSSKVRPGAPAFLAASGLITTDSTLRRIGSFDSFLNDVTLRVPGGVTSGRSLRVAGHQSIVKPDPIFVSTAGWARVRVHI